MLILQPLQILMVAQGFRYVSLRPISYPVRRMALLGCKNDFSAGTMNKINRQFNKKYGLTDLHLSKLIFKESVTSNTEIEFLDKTANGSNNYFISVFKL